MTDEQTEAQEEKLPVTPELPEGISPERTAEIFAADEHLQEMVTKLLAYKEVTKEQNKLTDAAQSQMNQLIHDARMGINRLPFDEGDQSWREVLLTDAFGTNISPLIIQGLAEAGIENVGQLADYTTPHPPKQGKYLTAIKGIGEAAATAIEEALDAFWASRSQPED